MAFVTSHLHLATFLGYSQSSQTNTSLFYTLCPHSCALGKYFPVGHSFINFCRPSTLKFRVLCRWASGKEVVTCWYASPINPIKLWARCYILTPLRDRHPRQSTSSQECPLLATSVHLVPAHVTCCVTTLGSHQPCTPCLRNCDTHAHDTASVTSDTIM
jgi:hypothetical protein